MSKITLVLDKNCKTSEEQYFTIPHDLRNKIDTCHINSDTDVLIGTGSHKPCGKEIADVVTHTPAWSINGQISYGFMTTSDLENNINNMKA